uniref:Putative alpha-snap protein n=1 Tax=Ixodes ricinus TaxID=34613 RepID=A0A131Y0J0_IXORI
MEVDVKDCRVLFSPSDSFILDGDGVCGFRSKQCVFDDDCDPDALRRVLPEFQCSCQQQFDNVQDFESHYAVKHRSVCSSCRASFPTAHLLELHITETHDPIFAARPADIPKYVCVVEGCPDLFATAVERKEHAISCHKYPANFRFLPRDASSRASSSAHRRPQAPVPNHVCFGRGSVPAWHRRRPAPKQRETEDISMADVRDALSDM